MSDWKNNLPDYCNNDTTSCNAYGHDWINKYWLGMLELNLRANKYNVEQRKSIINKYIQKDINERTRSNVNEWNNNDEYDPFFSEHLGGSKRRRLSKRRSNKKKSIRRKRR